VLFRALQHARDSVAGGERDANRVRQILDRTISLELSVKLDYVEVADANSLESLVVIEPERRWRWWQPGSGRLGLSTT